MYAAQLAAVPSYKLELGEPWDVAKIYWVTMSLSRVRADVAKLEERGVTSPFGEMSDGMMQALFAADDAVAAQVDGTEFAAAKMAALRAHATQIPADNAFFSLADSLGEHVWGLEEYRLAKGTQGPVDERGWESDLFAGLDV
jgi:N-acetyl-1-D-myo-inositol-2-amino-2-deoxy-alpha-D-glucopyranoside deacetylase